MFLVFPDERKRTKPIAPIPFVMIGATRLGRGIRTYIVDFGTWWKYLKPDDVQVTATPDAWRRNDQSLPRLVEVIRERATRQGSIEHPVTVRELLVSAFGPAKVDADLKRKSRRQRLLSDLNEAFEKARSQGIRWRVTGDSDSIDALIRFAAPPPPDICQIREFLQRTQTNLARDLNLSQSQVSRIEAGGYDLDPLQKLKLVKMLATESPNQGQRTNVSRRLGAGS
jgi:DNA-binding XRE family transcriptional regulator